MLTQINSAKRGRSERLPSILLKIMDLKFEG
jgi:hypothetical protein